MPLVIRATPIRTEYRTVEEWEVTWKRVLPGYTHPAVATMRTSDRYLLRAAKAKTFHRGRYEVKVNNRYGFLIAFTDVEIVTRKLLP